MSMFSMTLTEASDAMTGFDFITVRQTFGSPFEKLSGVEKVYAIYLVTAKREDPKVSFANVMAMTLPEVTNAFKPAEDATFPGPGTRPGTDTDGVVLRNPPVDT